MPEIIVDLSGAAGLSSRSFGDQDMVVPQPNLIQGEKSGGMAGGVFNPHIRDGYMSPSVSTSTAISSPDTLSSSLTAVAYDPVNDDIYWAGSNNKIYKQTTLTDLSLEASETLDSDAIVNDITFYEVDSVPVVLYVYDYPANTTDKERAVFIGYTSVLSNELPSTYVYDPIKIGTAESSFTIEDGGAFKLASLISSSALSNADHNDVELTDIFLKLKRSTDDEVQSWAMKLSVYSTSIGLTEDGNTHHIPNTLVDSTTVSSSVLTNDFEYVQFTFSAPVSLSGIFAVILEPDTPGDITGARGVEWLAGNVGASSTQNDLYYNGGWYQLTIGNVYKFALRTALDSSQNILPQSQYSLTSNFYGVESDSLSSGSTTGNISQVVTIDDKEDNIVIVSVVVRNGADEITGMTIGGQAMTQLYNNLGATASRLYVYYKENAPTGSQTIATTGITSDTRFVVSRHYGVKAGTITIANSATKTSGINESDGITGAGSLDPRGVALYVSTIQWYEVAGPDFYRAFPASNHSYVQADSTSSPGTNARPLYVAQWVSREEYISLFGHSMRIDQFDNGTHDNYIDGSYNGLIITVDPLDTSSSEERYWTFKGRRSGKAFIRNATNGFSYIFTDRAIHKFDGGITGGGSGLLTPNVIQFPDYHTIMDACDHRSKFYVITNQYPVDRTSTPTLNTFSGKSGIYVWNRISTQLGKDEYIELPGVREGRSIYSSPDGQLRLITISDNGRVELRQFGYNDSGGVVFPVIKRLGIGAFPQNPSGVKTLGDKTVWIGNDGNIYCDKDGRISIIHRIKSQSSSSAGAISNITGGALFYGSSDETADTGYRSNKQAISFSYKDGSTVYHEKVYPFDLKTGANATQTVEQGDVFTPVQFIPVTGVVKNIRVYNAPISGSGSSVVATVKLYFNQSASAGITKTITKDEAKRGYVDFRINKPYVHAVQAEVEWNTAEVLSGDTYFPSVMVISYSDSKMQSPDNG